MATAPLDRQTAAARTKMAKIAVVVCAATGGAIVAFGLPGVRNPPAPPPLELPVPDAPAAVDTSADTKPAVNLTAISDRFAMVNNHPVLPEEPKAPDLVKVDTPPPPPPPPPPEEIKYLGIVHMGSINMALVGKADKQMFVARGGKIGEDTLSEIADTHIVVGDRTIDLAPKSGDLVSHASSSGGGGGSPGAAMGSKNGMPRGAGVTNVNRGNMAFNNAAALAARAAGAKAGSARPQPQPQAQAGIVPAPNGIPMQPFPDQTRNQRYQILLEKYRNSGEYHNESDISEAALKQTDNEAFSGQLPGFDPATGKK